MICTTQQAKYSCALLAESNAAWRQACARPAEYYRTQRGPAPSAVLQGLDQWAADLKQSQVLSAMGTRARNRARPKLHWNKENCAWQKFNSESTVWAKLPSSYTNSTALILKVSATILQVHSKHCGLHYREVKASFSSMSFVFPSAWPFQASLSHLPGVGGTSVSQRSAHNQST